MRSVKFCNAAEVNNLLERKWISAPLYDLGALSKMKLMQLGGIFVYFRAQTGRHLGGYTVHYPHHSPPDILWNKHICLKICLEAKVCWLNSRIHSTHHAKHVYSHGDRHMLTEQSQARGHSSGLYKCCCLRKCIVPGESVCACAWMPMCQAIETSVSWL